MDEDEIDRLIEAIGTAKRSSSTVGINVVGIPTTMSLPLMCTRVAPAEGRGAMICKTCHGARTIERRQAGGYPVEEPCPTCGGVGIVNCCEGERPGNQPCEAGKNR